MEEDAFFTDSDEEEPMEDEDNSIDMEDLPMEFRACFNCRIIKTFGEYYSYGCPNCEQFMRFKNNIERIVHCTTLDFRGLFRMYTTFNKWETRIKPVATFAPGRYATLLFGIMPSRYLFQLLSEDDNDPNGHRSL